jgi:hypothetical protein
MIMVASIHSSESSSGAAPDAGINPSQFHASDDALADLRRRIAATNWADGELVSDASEGVWIATVQKLAHFWETEHD